MKEKKVLKQKRHKCISCHKLFDEKDIRYAPDPYQSDVNNNETNVWECDECRYESALEI